MPELPEVETIRRGLSPRLLGKSICAVVVRRNALRYPLPPRFAQLVKECVFCAIRRRGKYLLADLTNPEGKKQTMIIHLGMTGALFFAARRPVKSKHEHIGFLLPGGEYLIYCDPRRFGCILLADDADAHFLIRTIGREPLATSFNGAFLHQQWRGKTTAVKSALMDSGIVAGVGNIYASEALFLAGVCPATRAGFLSPAQCDNIAKAVKTILRLALKAGGSTIRNYVNSDGEAGHFQMQWRVYERAGQQCTQCPSRIVAMRQNNRTTYYCPECQPSSRNYA